MTEPNQARDADRLPEQAARRLLERASELEAARSAELSVAELREVAREAGIAPSAFEQALAEYRRTDPAAAATATAPRRRLPRLWPAALVAAALLSILVLRMLLPAA